MPGLARGRQLRASRLPFCALIAKYDRTAIGCLVLSSVFLVGAAVLALETFWLHHPEPDAVVINSEPRELVMGLSKWMYDHNEVRLVGEDGWATTHITSNDVGPHLESRERIDARIGNYSGLMLVTVDDGGSRYLILEPTLILGVLAFFGLLVPGLRHSPYVFLAACLHFYPTSWVIAAVIR